MLIIMTSFGSGYNSLDWLNIVYYDNVFLYGIELFIFIVHWVIGILTLALPIMFRYTGYN